MANDWILNMGVTGQEKLVGTLKDVTRELNEADKAADRQRRRLEAINSYRRRAGELARQERREAFQRLSAEEQLLRLQKQREQIQQRLTRAGQNEYRAAALRLKLSQTEAQIRAVTPTSAFGGGMMGGMLGGLGGRMMAGLGGMVGLGALVSSINRRLEEADRLKDTADITGMSLKEVLRVREAAMGLEGTRTEKAAQMSFAQLAALRADALGGNKEALGLFKGYGVSADALGSDSILNVAKTIRGSMGTEGPRPENAANLRTFFGRNYQAVLALLTEMGNMGPETTAKIEETTQSLAAAQTAKEKFKYKAGNIWDSIINKLVVEPWMNPNMSGGWGKGASYIKPAAAPGATPPAPFVPHTAVPQTGSVTPEVKALNPSLGPGVMPAADALARIGLFRGGVDVSSTLQQYKRQLDAIHRELQHLRSDVAKEVPVV
ncbi:MAG: hypothetical protein AB9869_01275 [Verrucomicrobiia bacterium]